MGPSPVGDGEQGGHRNNDQLKRASMGPSPVGDGERDDHEYDDGCVDVLQWGRRLLATESPGHAEGSGTSVVASMGPSPVGDGETWTRCLRRCSCRPLQWGRRLLATESAGHQEERPSLFYASMGPSPVGDGEIFPALYDHAAEQASMGPSPVGDGEGSGAIRSDLIQFCKRFRTSWLLRGAVDMVTVRVCRADFRFFSCFRWVPSVGGAASGSGEMSRHRAARSDDFTCSYSIVTEHGVRSRRRGVRAERMGVPGWRRPRQRGHRSGRYPR